MSGQSNAIEQTSEPEHPIVEVLVPWIPAACRVPTVPGWSLRDLLGDSLGVNAVAFFLL